MRMHLDPRLHDEQLWAEIELCADVIIAVSQTAGPLSMDSLDRALGLPETVVLILPTHPPQPWLGVPGQEVGSSGRVWLT